MFVGHRVEELRDERLGIQTLGPDLWQADGLNELHEAEGRRLAPVEVGREALRHGGLDDLGRSVEGVEFLTDIGKELIDLAPAEVVADPPVPHAEAVLHQERGKRQLTAALDDDEETLRARTVMRSTERVNEDDVTTYAGLGDPRWQGRMCLRSGTSEYNVSFVADRIAKDGQAETCLLYTSPSPRD